MLTRKTIAEHEVREVELPKRKVKLLVGPETLGSQGLNFGVTEVPPHTAMDFHVHEGAEEIIYILSGWGEVVVDGQTEPLKPGTAVYFPRQASHSVKNLSDETMKFTFCFSPPFWVGGGQAE
ncbi:MAG: cupin domain-containing protein [Bacillota bacterium]|nr:cupin domain-containing protein [Bacillota bacterium]